MVCIQPLYDTVFYTVITGNLVIMAVHFIKVCGLVFVEISNQGETLEGIQ